MHAPTHRSAILRQRVTAQAEVVCAGACLDRIALMAEGESIAQLRRLVDQALMEASEKLTAPLEHVLYNAQHGFTL